jgi:hypothetical protein
MSYVCLVAKQTFILGLTVWVARLDRVIWASLPGGSCWPEVRSPQAPRWLIIA